MRRSPRQEIERREARPKRNPRRIQRLRHRRSTDELRQIARDIHAGKIWTHLDVPPDLFESVFMVLFFMDSKGRRELAQDLGRRGIIFEYGHKAMPRGINGYPCFVSAQVLPSGEATVVREMVRNLHRATVEALS